MKKFNKKLKTKKDEFTPLPRFNLGRESIKHKAKKSLGQNFLKSILAINKTIEAGELDGNDVVLEIGPGKGVLTEKLLQKAGKVIAIEKDQDLIEILEVRFKEETEKGKFVLVNKDILKIDIKDYLLLPPNTTAKNLPQVEPGEGKDLPKLLPRLNLGRGALGYGYKIIANIPYNITGAILEKFLTETNKPERMVLMIQKEVAERIIANNKKESLLSISVKLYGEPKIIMKVPKRYFSPSPKVDSAIILIKNISNKIFEDNKIEEKLFWEILHSGFAHKRKVLLSNLKKDYPKTDFISIFNKNNIKDKTRAEDLSLSDWINIIRDIK